MATYTASVTLTCALTAATDRDAHERVMHLTGLLEGYFMRPEWKEVLPSYMSDIEVETTELVPEE